MQRKMTEERRNKIESVLSKRQNDLAVVLENVFDPHNISAIMRSCDAVGIQEIYVLNTRIPFHKNWGFHSSRSASKWITVLQFDDVHQCFAAVRAKYPRILATHLSEKAENLYDLDLTQKTALVFGNEQYGVSDEVISMADGNFVIPQVGMIHSLNISVACAVTLYEAYRQKEKAGHFGNQKLSEFEFASIGKQWGLEYEKTL
ncbi:RNA methyltransferase [Chitinophagaceae bacterium LB-8]|uniref:tRNA (guanosine(18)-2'-O)-methyltransferase n=1 Tax=Paraflavisolibacter caeni TaxID=2982496 RepID=A0A9X2XWK2_9BACT|nr:RNA methyltransferase [Paraflavisolibacter caeni]MCU7549063.1 RNA methyltransferase [Paraflavisolibacter caeni]